MIRFQTRRRRKFSHWSCLRCRTHICHGTRRSCRGISTEATRYGCHIWDSVQAEKWNFIFFLQRYAMHFRRPCSRTRHWRHTYLARFFPLLLLLPGVPSSRLVLGGRLYLLLLTSRLSANTRTTRMMRIQLHEREIIKCKLGVLVIFLNNDSYHNLAWRFVVLLSAYRAPITFSFPYLILPFSADGQNVQGHQYFSRYTSAAINKIGATRA